MKWICNTGCTATWGSSVNCATSASSVSAFGGGTVCPQGMRMRSELGTQRWWRRMRCYSMPLRRIWLAAISMTLMMKAMAKAQIRLFLTQVCLFCFWECTRGGGAEGRETWRERRGERNDTVRQAAPLPQQAQCPVPRMHWSNRVDNFWEQFSEETEHRVFWHVV